MVMGGNGGDATAWGGGFAARASRRETDEGPAAGSVGGGRTGYVTPRGGASGCSVDAGCSGGSREACDAQAAERGYRPGQTAGDDRRRLGSVDGGVGFVRRMVRRRVARSGGARHGRRAPHAGGCRGHPRGRRYHGRGRYRAGRSRNVPGGFGARRRGARCRGACCGRACDRRYPGGNAAVLVVRDGDGRRSPLGRAESGLAGGDARGGRGDRARGPRAALRHGAHRVCGGRVGRRGVPRDGVRARPRRCGGRRCNRRAERFRLRHGGSVARGG